MKRLTLNLGLAAICTSVLAMPIAADVMTPVSWTTIVNNGSRIPKTNSNFLSFNQPSLNGSMLVTFRGRAAGPSQPMRGLYRRDMSMPGQPIMAVADTTMEVPSPNNTQYPDGSGVYALFREFPAIPRVDVGANMIASRGESQPVWTYMLPDGTESRVGSAGIYVWSDGTLRTAVTLLGAVRDPDTGELVFPWFSVPGAPDGTRFDQFPGAPAISDGQFVVFKGNHTDPKTDLGLTGVYFRDLLDKAGKAPVQLLASSNTRIPNQGPRGDVTFGSTAPPSAVNGHAVFVGLDNEDEPTMGGLYLVKLRSGAELQPLVEIGQQVPGEPHGDTFTRIGEGLSFDGRYVGFWGAWGREMFTITLECPEDGNPDILEYCAELHPNGFTTEIPVNQGIFVFDTMSGALHKVARTGAVFDDFLYWVFSGRPPGTGHGDEVPTELARWRSSAFVAVESAPNNAFRVGFKAASGDVDGLYLGQGPTGAPLRTLVDTTTPGQDIDPSAPPGSVVITVGLERESFRAGHIGINAGMYDPVSGESWAGLYIGEAPDVVPCPQDLDGSGDVGVTDLMDVIVAWGRNPGHPADFDGDGYVNVGDLVAVINAWGPCR